MTETSLEQCLLDLGVPAQMVNDLGPSRDFAFNLVSNKGRFDLYWQEKGLRTYILKSGSRADAEKMLMEELRGEYS